MNINRLVNLTITISDRTVQGIDLGIPLILAYHTHWADLVRAYSSTDEMLLDGFTTDEYGYQVARTVFSQEKAPPQIKIGRRVTPLTQTFRLVPTNTTVGFVYKGTIAAQPFTFTVVTGTLAAVCTGLAAAITALLNVTATDGTTFVGVTADTAGKWWDINPGDGIKMLDLTPDTTTDDEIVAIQGVDEEWYGLLVESSSPATIALVGATMEQYRKIAIVQSPDYLILDSVVTSDIASVMLAAGYNRTFGIWHSKVGGTEWLAAAWESGRLVAQPGSETWAFKTLQGPSFDKISTSAENAIIAKNWSMYTRTAKRSMTFDGRAGGGRYGDITRFIDWLYSDIQTSVVAAFGDNDKIDNTNEGAALIKSVIGGSLQRGERRRGIVKGSSVVTVPDVNALTASQRATRILPDVNFSARLTGALHGVQITGLVTT